MTARLLSSQRIVNNPRVTSKMIEEYRLLWVEISLLTHRLSSLFIEKISTHFIVQISNTIISVYIWIFYSVDVVDFRLDVLILHIFYVFSSLMLVLSYCNSGYMIGHLVRSSHLLFRIGDGMKENKRRKIGQN